VLQQIFLLTYLFLTIINIALIHNMGPMLLWTV